MARTASGRFNCWSSRPTALPVRSLSCSRMARTRGSRWMGNSRQYSSMRWAGSKGQVGWP
ncbi:hypothetical protein RY27_16795 [Litorilinea aerophila]|nr:hypothetical protein RY27_16795 [Litorilinea aerophila]